MSHTFSLYDLRVTVAEIGGRSVCGMIVGDWFELRNSSQLVLLGTPHGVNEGDAIRLLGEEVLPYFEV